MLVGPNLLGPVKSADAESLFVNNNIIMSI